MTKGCRRYSRGNKKSVRYQNIEMKSYNMTGRGKQMRTLTNTEYTVDSRYLEQVSRSVGHLLFI